MREVARLSGFLLLVVLSVAGGFVIGRRNPPAKPEPKVIVRVDTCVVFDTIVCEKPVFRYSYIYDTIVTHFTTVEHDTVEAVVPLERRIYAEDSLYRAVVSGWRPSLDTLIVWPTVTTITVREREVVPRSRWAFGATVGPSVIASPSGKVHAGIGITAGVSYRF